MKGKTKSEFKISIRECIMNWLNDKEKKYEFPLSQKQFHIAGNYCPFYETKKISNRIYWDRNY